MTIPFICIILAYYFLLNSDLAKFQRILSYDYCRHLVTKKDLHYKITKDSFLSALREVSPEMELFLENHGQ